MDFSLTESTPKRKLIRCELDLSETRLRFEDLFLAMKNVYIHFGHINNDLIKLQNVSGRRSKLWSIQGT